MQKVDYHISKDILKYLLQFDNSIGTNLNFHAKYVGNQLAQLLMLIRVQMNRHQ